MGSHTESELTFGRLHNKITSLQDVLSKRTAIMRFALVLAIVVVGVGADLSPTSDPLKPREYSTLLFRRPPPETSTWAEKPKNPLECDGESSVCGRLVDWSQIRLDETIQEIRCINKAMGPNKDITYTINGLHGGEIRWDCKESDDDAEKLGEYGYNLEDTTVHCEDVKGDCKVVYKLGINLDFF